MILADKILLLRKKNGWSQEELAEKASVSRQAVSKWESAQSVPDIGKVLELAKLFGVSTDYLLKDEIEETEYTETDDAAEGDSRRHVSLEEASDFLKNKENEARKIAVGVLLCILSPVLLVWLGAASEVALWGITESIAFGIGIAAMFLLVACAVAVFIFVGMRGERFKYLEKNNFVPDYGVLGMARERKQASTVTYTVSVTVGVVLCILAVIPLVIAGVADAPDLWVVSFVALLLCLVGVAVYLFVRFGVVRGSYDLLLSEGEYDREELKKNEKVNRISGIYWPVVTAGYLLWSFLADAWQISWVVWPIAALVFAAVSAVFRKED